MKADIEAIISANKDAIKHINALRKDITKFKVTDEASKANFGNLCIALRGYEMVEEATSCMLSNDDIIITNDGEYYKKIDDIDDDEEDNDKNDDKSENATCPN